VQKVISAVACVVDWLWLPSAGSGAERPAARRLIPEVKEVRKGNNGTRYRPLAKYGSYGPLEQFGNPERKRKTGS
jgi:hypothetical protein